MAKTSLDVLTELTLALRTLKKEDRAVSTEDIRLITKQPSVVTARWLDFFIWLGKIEVSTKTNDKGIVREIDLSKFDL